MKRENQIRWSRALLSLLMVAVVAICLLPLSVSAAESKGPVICLSTADGENVKNAAAGIPINFGDVGGILTTPDLYETDNLYYVAGTQSGNTYEMTYSGNFMGLALFSTDAKDLSGFYSNLKGPEEGGQYTLRGINADGAYVNRNVTITQVSTQESSEGGFDINIEGDIGDVMSPAVVVDGDTVVAICTRSRFFALSESSGSGGGNGGGNGGNDGGSGGSNGSGSGSSAARGNTTQGTNGKDWLENKALIAGGCAVIAVLIGGGIFWKKKNGGTNNRQNIQIPPNNPGGNVGGNYGGNIGGNYGGNIGGNYGGNIGGNYGGNFGGNAGGTPTVPVSSGAQPVAGLYVEIVNGPMAGQQYPVPYGGKLLIGRSPEANICYPADTRGVSRKHCQIFWNNGSLQLMDLGSTSGTFVSGKGQLIANTPVALTENAVIYLGSKAVAITLRSRRI